MATQVLMPALSPTMTEGKLAKWLKAEGDPVASGDALAEIETDKATMEVEAVDEGVLGKILVPEGTENVAVNTPIAVIVEEGEDVSDVEAPAALAPGPAPAPPSASSPPAAAPDVPRAAPEAAPEPDYDGPMVTLTVRDALRDAMAEEMRRDDRVYLMGEEVAQYQGAYKISQGLLEEFGPERVIDTPITEHGFTGLGVGAAFGGLKPIHEFMTCNFAVQDRDQITHSATPQIYNSGRPQRRPIDSHLAHRPA